LLAPNRFTLIVHPTLECAMPEKADLLDALAGILQHSGEDAGWCFLAPPVVRVIPDDRLSPQEIQIVAAFSPADAGDTTSIPHEYTPNGASAQALDKASSGLETSTGTVKPTGKLKPAAKGSPGGPASAPVAFLIVEGSRTVILTSKGVTIGRRPDMSLVLDNPHVSRVHAQIRLVQGRFVIFDLDSSGGTFVNGQRVAQSILHAGDVISLSGVQLIYGQEANSSLDETQEISMR
jgi:hypothetical protein